MFENITQFFARMNDVDFVYVVLRNFEGLPESVTIGEHGDLDLLVYDLEHWKELFPMAIQEFPDPRVRYKVPIGAGHVYMDVRHVGDDYYPIEFENNILATREYNPKGFWTPNPIHFRTALVYHVVHHKGVNKYQKWIGDASFEEYLSALKASNIGWVEPKDKTVGRLNPYWKGCTSTVTKKDGKVCKKQTSYNGYDLAGNEIRILCEMDSIHFPECYGEEDGGIMLEDCGEQLSVHNLPHDWKEQLVKILLDLKTANVQHRDIRLENLMVKDGTIKLIDFGWARFYSEDDDNPPSCLGYPNKPSWGFDDNFSMRKIIKQLEYELEERYANIGN